ncbi:LPXTG cell wall anchor domain-containing protein [Kitasatospora sp. NPDC088391]|uniref:LPXTG cell wall anchor domain-containing protein n=1 Tax=Kitasatospora sp. NPDC088391 TaxID=3364074 RepID=UPI003805AB5E
MNHPRSRALAASATLTLLGLGVLAAPAATAVAEHRLLIDAPASVQISSTPKQPAQWDENLHLRVGRTGTGTVNGVKLDFDTRDLAGTAQLTVPGCATAGTVVTCDVNDLQFDSINITHNPWLSAAAGAKPGSSAVLHLRLYGGGTVEAAKDVRVDVGAPRFKTKDLQQVTARTGDTVTPEVVFANRGESAATALYVEITALSGLTPAQVPANCEYQDNPDGAYGDRGWPGSVNVACAVDATIGAGQVYKLSPFSFKVGPTARYTFADISLFPTVDAETSQLAGWRANGPLKRGTGPAMTVGGATDAGLLTGELHDYDNRVEQEVSADNPADFSAGAAWTPADGGKKGTLTVAEANAGPASIFDRSGGESSPGVRAVLPAGVTATKVPDGCRAVEWENGKHIDHPNTYDCGGPYWVPAGYLKSYAFELAVENPAAAPKAVVSLQNQTSIYEPGHPSAVMGWDHNAANDLVEIALGASAGGGLPDPKPSTTPTGGTGGGTAPTAAPSAALPTGTPSGRATASAAPSTTAAGRTTGGLASTGSDGSGTLLALGLGAVGLGTAAVLVARRKRGARA